MDAQQSEEPRAWGDNHDWLLNRYKCLEWQGNELGLLCEGMRIPVRMVFGMSNFKASEDSDTDYLRALVYDRTGTFWGIVEADGGRKSEVRTLIKKLTGKAALTWFAEHASWDAAFTRELCRAFDNPAFEFFPLVPTRLPGKRQRKKAKAAEAFHEQLHLATALVECVRKLEDAPTVENLAEAQRSVSALHQQMHRPENFKLASQG